MFKPLPDYRISFAALGKLLATVLEMERQSMMAMDQFHDTIYAVYNRAIYPEFTPGTSNHHPLIYAEMVTRIEKSARRSAAAKAAAKRRKERREAAQQNLDYNRPEPARPETKEERELREWQEKTTDDYIRALKREEQLRKQRLALAAARANNGHYYY